MMARLLVAMVLALLPMTALAELPVFQADCPLGNRVDGDRYGTIRVNGIPAAVQRFNENYYEARIGGATITIANDARGLLVGFEPAGRRGGYCRISAQTTARPPVQAPPGARMAAVTGVARNDVLNVRSGPGPGFPARGALANGERVRLLDCKAVGGARWCRIEMLDDMRSQGWVNALYLDEGIGARPTAPPQVEAKGTIRVRFPPGASGTQMTGRLRPGQSQRYVVGASAMQMLRVRVIAHGPGLSYGILNPDRTPLLDRIGAAQSYAGQLWQRGDHVIEVTNQGGSPQAYDLVINID